MHIRSFFDSNRPVFSIELFPPKTEKGVENLKARLHEIRAFQPDYLSVTYGAGGGTRHNTLELCTYIKQELDMEVMAHLTCVSHTREEIESLVGDYRAAGVENIMALRGDPPQGETAFVPPVNGFHHAADLVRSLKEMGGLGIGIAGYPEGHVEAESYEADLARQAEKAKAGADVIISQLFFENETFLRWRDDLRAAGVAIPIEAGILPPLSNEQVIPFAAKCGVEVPSHLLARMARFSGDKEGAQQAGLDYAMEQIEGLMAEGVDGIHLYALNRIEPIQAVEPLIRGRKG